MTAGGWLFMTNVGRKVDQNATMTESSKCLLRDE
jgi:hypothetical protein